MRRRVSPLGAVLGRLVMYGRLAVVVFIVLSGFSLALSPARDGWRLDAVSGPAVAWLR